MEKSKMEMLQNSCLIVAHPDDEILWFSSILSNVESILICYLGNTAKPGRGEARQKVLDKYPLGNIHCLGWDVPLTRQYADWTNPIETEFGMVVPHNARHLYEDSFRETLYQLKERLNGFENVFTHNPWGEYGHEMHIQLHRVIASLSTTLKFKVWFSNYAAKRSLPLALKRLHGSDQAPVCLKTNTLLADEIRDLYIEEDCWTAPKNHIWPTSEYFNYLPKQTSLDYPPSVGLFPLNILSW